jgi:hypothetical protein
MVIEQTFQNQILNKMKDDPTITSGDLEFYDDIALDTVLNDEGGKYQSLLDELTGLPGGTRNDIVIFANGYHNRGFYDTVYDKKVQPPSYYKLIGWGLTIVGLLFSFILLIIAILRGKFGWGLLLILPWLILFVIGASILTTYYITHNTWGLVTATISIPSKLGLLKISESDINKYNEDMLKAGKRFLETGVLQYDDNSGLTYIDREGKLHHGALTEGSKRFNYIVLPILVTMLIAWNALFLFLIFYKRNKNRKK